ncbi:predicted protein [Sclerotinia sclerotiorum 1980 UF-70]|uniref:F-box domain-containing protein n=1 Tax=Sclerotinia sclerotiorum (strain ATCC 18683 / 1980 / Ss-1) TaxID=665079 RepID=A7EVP7_SCLS1|nr:predicted protein [Sclerotinia sclerotiorum 1980 UF-70]EDN93539.1 predicted protein [Sclerotinia sclerotiorum 1980 UF-70]
MPDNTEGPKFSNNTIHPLAIRNKKTPQSGVIVSYDDIKAQTLDTKLPKPKEEVGLPQEIIRIICSYVDADELPNLRLVSIGFSNAAAVRMYRTMDFTFTASSLKRLLNVAHSTRLQHHVFKLRYNAKWMSTWPISWEPECLEYHFSHQRELEEVLIKLVNLSTIEFRPRHQDPQHTLENRLVTHRRIFDPFWKFLTSSLRHVSRLRSIIASNSFPYEGESLEEFSTEEIGALGRLENLTLRVHTHFGRRLPNLLYYMSNLKSLELRELVDLGERDFSELVNPNFITHAKGSSFPLPHPDEDLRNVDLRLYGGTRGLFLVNILRRNGSIRLLRRKLHKPSVYNGYLDWEQPGFAGLAIQDDTESDASQYDPDEVVVEVQNIAEQAKAFARAKAYFLANQDSWNDEEKVTMAFLVDADPMSFEVEVPAPFNSPRNLNLI